MTRTIPFLAIVAMLGSILLAGCGGSSNSGSSSSGGIGTGSGAGSKPGGPAFYFTATDGVYGRELYRTDGTTGGTLRVKDINPGAGDSILTTSLEIIEFPAGSATWYFAADDGTHGNELWKTDGSEAGTVMVADINTSLTGGTSTNTQGSYPQGFVIYDNGLGAAMYFRASDGIHGQELWKYDGTNPPVMVADINTVPVGTGTDSAYPYEMTVFNGLLVFRANDGTSGWELWKSDGKPCPIAPATGTCGTVRIADINTGAGDSQPNGFVAISPTQLLFNADDGVHGQELWSTDGNSATMVMDINSGSNSSAPFDLTLLNGTVYFQANDGTHGIELWRTDGTPAGTLLVADINNGVADSNPYGLTVFDNGSGPALYFRATTASSGAELWRSDGVPCPPSPSTCAGTKLVADINTGAADSSPYEFAVLNKRLYFAARDASYGRELWVSDGVPCTATCGTTQLVDINPVGNSSPQGLRVFNNGTQKLLMMTATDGFDGRELWASDGSAAGTRMIKDILIGTGSGVPNL